VFVYAGLRDAMVSTHHNIQPQSVPMMFDSTAVRCWAGLIQFGFQDASCVSRHENNGPDRT